MPRGGAPANKPHKTDDDNDDWCAVCKMKGDLLMCDACCLSFHCGCIGYADDKFLSDDDPWYCWQCSKQHGVEFAVDTRSVNPESYRCHSDSRLNVMFVAIDDSLEHYYKYTVGEKKQKRGRRFTLTLQTGKAVKAVEVEFDPKDRRIWRGNIYRTIDRKVLGQIAEVDEGDMFVSMMNPAAGIPLEEYPVPMVPEFHLSIEKGKEALAPRKPPVYKGGKAYYEDSPSTEETLSLDQPVVKRARKRMSFDDPIPGDDDNSGEDDSGEDDSGEDGSDRSTGQGLRSPLDLLSSMAIEMSLRDRKEVGADPKRGSRKKRLPMKSGATTKKETAKKTATERGRGRPRKKTDPAPKSAPVAAEVPLAVSALRMTETAMALDKDHDVEVWINQTDIGPGGWVPGKVAERSLVDVNGAGYPYFAFYKVDTVPITLRDDECAEKANPARRGPHLQALLRVQKPLAAPVGCSFRGPTAVLVRKPPESRERKRVGKFHKGDRVEAIVCGRYAPGHILEDTADDAKTCSVQFDNPEKDDAFARAGKTQPIESVFLREDPASRRRVAGESQSRPSFIEC